MNDLLSGLEGLYVIVVLVLAFSAAYAKLRNYAISKKNKNNDGRD